MAGKKPLGHREEALRYRRKTSSETRDIGEIPSCQYYNRRKRATDSLSVFCREYQPAIFTRPFASVHYGVIETLEKSVNEGGLYAYAMPRGTGKTSLAEAACLWALLTGKRRYVVLISSTEKHANQSLANIKKELSSNDYIYQDWPEVVYPIWALENISHRASGQLYNGESTYLIWRGEQLVLPSIPESKAAGSVVEVRGLTGAIRGMKCNLPGGKGTVRPELVILDDPQTDESARSVSQCETREQVILGTVLGLAGHERQISVMMPGTAIRKGDLIERFLDNDKRPEWHGVRTSLLTSMPKNTKLWDHYYDLRREGGEVAQKFYIENQEEMDRGGEPLWEECYTANQVSAIQYAMDLKAIVGEQAFWAEYQNEPLDDITDEEMFTVEDVLAKTTKFKRGQVPGNCHYLTAFIDVHKRILYHMVCGWEENFTGFIIEYMTLPKIHRKYFVMREIQETLQAKYPGMGVDGAIYAGLKELTGKLIEKEWGVNRMKIGKIIIDANWATALVKTFCRESEHGTIVIPGHGRYIGVDRKPLNEYRKYAGDRDGPGWRIPTPLDRGGIRHVIYDINYLKSFINSAILSPPGEKGCLQIFGGADHALLADHFTAEYFVETSARGRTVRHWQQRPGHEDNHWWDCVVGCAAGAGILGCRTVDAPQRSGGMRVTLI